MQNFNLTRNNVNKTEVYSRTTVSFIYTSGVIACQAWLSNALCDSMFSKLDGTSISCCDILCIALAPLPPFSNLCRGFSSLICFQYSFSNSDKCKFVSFTHESSNSRYPSQCTKNSSSFCTLRQSNTFSTSYSSSSGNTGCGHKGSHSGNNSGSFTVTGFSSRAWNTG